jgi:hypothetical protein
VTISGLEIEDKDLQSTKQLIKSEKNGLQNEAITTVLAKSNLLNKNNCYIEFGAGRGGLSHHINTLLNDSSFHILLERDGVRFKRDRHSANMIRVSVFNFSLKLTYLILILITLINVSKTTQSILIRMIIIY